MKKKVDIDTFATKTKKFRSFIKEKGQPPYSVTIGGTTWENGKGREYEHVIRIQCERILIALQDEFSESFKEEVVG